MNTFFNSVHITNFKSLKDVTLSDCKRINLLIGKPNVGKSNILEAIGLFGLGHCRLNTSQKLSQFIRFEDTPELFFDADINTVPSVEINLSRFGVGDHYKSCKIKYSNSDTYQSDHSDFIDKQLVIEFRNGDTKLYDELIVDSEHKVAISGGEILSVKQYKFPCILDFGDRRFPYLIPPHGINLFQVIDTSKRLKEYFSNIFADYGLKLLLDKTNRTLRLQKNIDNENVASFPYSSIADSLQRLIFFKAAITSNQNSILLFEEPEAHCFPPYIGQITQDIINSETNQFFIATHSPYVLEDFLENVRTDLAIFMADFKDEQTVVKRLTDAELNDVYEYGLDLFFNAELFTDEI